MPNDEIYAPGCAKFNRRDTSALSIDTLALQAHVMGLDQYNTVLTLASTAHYSVLCEVFSHAYIQAPLSGKGGIGKQMGALSVAIKAQTPLV